MDLLNELSKRINFTYELSLSPDGLFGSFMYKNATGNHIVSTIEIE
jgi:ionotropic glutamate receptor NMDA 1